MIQLLALLIDQYSEEPPNRLHPVAWMGSLIGQMRKWAPGTANPRGQFAFGGLISIVGIGLAVILGWLIRKLLCRLPGPVRWLVEAGLLKLMLSVRGLGRAAGEIQSALEKEDLPEARRLTGWHMVSRDTSTLTASRISAAAVESVAENTTDSIVAPLFYYSLFGLPGAIAYRFVNTADAMLGYRDEAREWLGKIPARLDDILNYIPARLTATLLLAAAWLQGFDTRHAFRTWVRDHRKTTSPNAGQTMSVAAGSLGIELEKEDHYILGQGDRKPEARDIGRSVRLMVMAAWLATGLFGLLSFLMARRK